MSRVCPTFQTRQRRGGGEMSSMLPWWGNRSFDFWFFYQINTTLSFCISKSFLRPFGDVLRIFNALCNFTCNFELIWIWFCAVFPQNLNCAKIWTNISKSQLSSNVSILNSNFLKLLLRTYLVISALKACADKCPAGWGVNWSEVTRPASTWKMVEIQSY